MKNDRRTAEQLLPVHTRSPEAYMFLGVRMKALLSSKDTGGQFSLIEGFMPLGGDGGLHLHANEDESMHLLEGELEVTSVTKSSLLLQEKATSFRGISRTACGSWVKHLCVLPCSRRPEVSTHSFPRLVCA
jgi:hypothetical protein